MRRTGNRSSIANQRGKVGATWIVKQFSAKDQEHQCSRGRELFHIMRNIIKINDVWKKTGK